MKNKAKVITLNPSHQVNVMFTPAEYGRFEQRFQQKLKTIEPGMRLTRSGYARMLIMSMLQDEVSESNRIGSDA
jgi:hypothetical protein